MTDQDHSLEAPGGARARAAALAVGLVGVGLGIAFPALALGQGPIQDAAGDSYRVQDELFFQSFNVACVVVGALLAARRPRNPIGWLIAVIGLGFATYPPIVVAVARLDAAEVPLVAWFGNWTWVFGHAGVVGLFFLFPTGRTLSRFWARVFRVVVAILVTVLVVAALYPELEAAPGFLNPFGVEVVRPLIEPLIAAMLATEVMGAVALVVRFRRSQGAPRQQLKWLAYAVSLFAVDVLVRNWLALPRWTDVLAPLAILAAVVIAVTRYRLYAIDRLVNRTLVYGLVTGLLACVYLGLVTAVSLFTPASRASPLAVAASTLAAAALFRPARARVQRLVDRRFDRARYDAAKVVDGYRAHVREVVDLDAVTGELLGAAARSVQPASVGMWLRMQLP